MARFYGKVGYISTEEIRPGVYPTIETERMYYGDILSYSSRWDSGVGVNDDINVNVEISIMADPYAYQHFSEIKYVEYMGALWEVNNITPERPRIKLKLGGLWNGQQN